MKFQVSSSTLRNRLQALGHVINSKSTLDILKCFLFELSGDQLKITASDGEITLVSTLSVQEVSEEGRVAVHAELLLNGLKEIPEQPLTLEINPITLAARGTYQNGTFNLVGQVADEYPTGLTSLREDAATLSISAEKLLANLNRTVFAASDEELRPVMTGVFFELAPESLTFVATDGRRLVCVKDTSVLTGKESSFILPRKPASLLRNLLVKESEVAVAWDEKNASFKTDNFNLTCRLIEGKYPNYNTVIPMDNPNKITVDRLSLLSLLRRVLPFSSQGTGLVKLELETNLLKVSTQDVDFDKSAEEKMTCEYSGMSMKIGFNGSYLIEMLNILSSEDVVIELADPSRAGLLVPVQQEEDLHLVMLVMPTMLND